MENKSGFETRPLDDKIRKSVDHFRKLKSKHILDAKTFQKTIDTIEAYAKGEKEGEWPPEDYQQLLEGLRAEGIIE
ncbi:MAG: hypothetical protein WCT16_04955 [Candidatus Buchananbacteria bacterium]